MTRERFRFLTYFLSFDIETERVAHYKMDRFAAFREFIEYFNKNSLDHMAGMRSQISFKTYIANKPHKYGILFKSINAARFPYIFCCLPYCGKGEQTDNAP